MTTYWVDHAFLPTGVASSVRITVTDGRFTEIQPRTRPQPKDVVLEGMVLPGLANGHSHAFHRALRGRTHDGGGDFWTWREVMYAVAQRLTPDTYLALARAVFAEMALAGYTAVGEFHYLHHGPKGARYDDPNAMGRAVIQAAEDVGIRLTLLDTCYLTGGLGGDGHHALDEIQLRFGDGDVDAWADRVSRLQDTDTVRIGAAAHSVRGVPRSALKELADVVDGRVVHAHVSEQIAENVAAQAFYGMSPTALLADAGLVTDRFTAVHATNVEDEDVEILRDAGATVCFCPTTERDLADGIGPARRFHDAGVHLSLGSDQNAVIDPFEEIRGLEMHERLISNERGRFSLPDLMTSASAAGYASLGWYDGGALCVGALADFVVVRLDTLRTAGSRPGQVLLTATGPDVSYVVVGGRPVVVEGRHRFGPVDQLLSEALNLLRTTP
ncbi:Putative Formiminoglutamic iminohydrolase [Nostocoides japonicum T1-X7]|uniref:Putative Formiminoglutamic iminohydrolase n=1 Tax=Nostocoides japonicum T1-X7 TaxID=1194083 RepID=A0A077LUR5_9MICO|nr:formimidoylglutamate deiminase [Tetrasphaera japonica]CCH76442.1 Putative Formiminoglutamic iminohydrolase [Tetrasphaera japonica T1-X7]